MPAAVKSADTRGGQSRVPPSELPTRDVVGLVGGGGGTTYAVAGASARPGGPDMGAVPTRVDSSFRDDAGYRPAPFSDGWNPRASMAFDSAKGLLNPVGENNCFLNSAVQVLWHLDAFRRNFRLLTGHACMDHSCIFCALKVMFTQFQYSSSPVLPPFNLRQALARSFADEQRYQLGRMDDAAECFENILMRIHKHLAPDVDEDSCQELHCIPHRKFAMTIIEQAVCQCGATAEPLPFTEIVHYVSTRAMISICSSSRRACSFGQLLSSACDDGDQRTCPKNCGGTVSIRRTLTNAPEVMSVGLVWDSERPTFNHIRDVFRIIETVVHPAEIFYSLVEADWAVSAKFHLVGLVCYYGRHYSTFFFHSKMKIWILFDDSHVRKLGAQWRHVAEQCIAGRYQPLLLLYANSSAEPLDVSSAPDRIIHLQEHLPANQTEDGRRDRRMSRYRERVAHDKAYPVMSSAAPPQFSAVSAGTDRILSDKHVTSSSSSSSSSWSSGCQNSDPVDRCHERGYRDVASTPQCRPHEDVLPSKSGMYSISENEEYYEQKSTANDHAIHSSRPSASSSRPASCVKDVPREVRQCWTRETGLPLTSSRAGLQEWCKESVVDGSADDVGTYIRRDDVRKVLELCGQKMAAASVHKDPAGLPLGSAIHHSSKDLNQSASGCQRTPGLSQDGRAVTSSSVTHGQDSAVMQKGSTALPPNSSGNRGAIVSCQGSSKDSTSVRKGSAIIHPEASRLANGDAVDSVSVGSHKDSGYRSEEDHHSGGECSSESPTLSASNSAVSLSSVSNCDPAKYPDVKSLCSSFESLSSVQSARSLPVPMETRLQTIPEGLRSRTPAQDSSRTARHDEAADFFTRSARAIAISGYRSELPAKTGSDRATMSASSACSRQMNETVSSRQKNQFVAGGRNDGCVRHAESVPAISHLSDADLGVQLLEGGHHRPSASSAGRYTGHMAVAPGGQSVPHRHEADQAKTSVGRVQGRGHLRETGPIVASLRQAPPQSKSADFRYLIRHTALPANKPPWK